MIPYGRHNISESDIEAVIAVLRSDFLTQGPMVPRFEAAVATYCGAKHGVAVNSATGALHIACLALGAGSGDIVWTSPITFVASANCALYCGASVDFVDIDPRTYNMCAERLAEKLTQAAQDGRLPKVVIPVHLSGQSCDMAAIAALAERYGFRITPAQLGDAITERTCAVVLNYPSNPTGHSYSPAQLRELADVLAGRDIIVVADEMYDQLVYGGHEHVSWATLSEETYGKTLTLNAVSKTYAMTGWRLGYAAGPADLIKAMAKLQSQSTSGTVNFCQYGLVAALSGDQKCVEEMRLEYDRRRNIMYAGLCALDSVSCVEPAGAFYCFPNVSATYARLGVQTSIEFAEKLLEEGHVAVVPGVAFGNDLHVRLSYAVNEERIREGLSRFGKFLGT